MAWHIIDDVTTNRVVLGAACAAALFLAGCQSKTATPAAPPADAYAVVNGHAITRDDVERAFRQTSDPSQPLSATEALTTKVGVLDDLIVEALLTARAQQEKLQVADADVDKALADAKKGQTDQAFEQQLTARKLTLNEVRDGLRRRLLAQKALDHDVTEKVTVSDQEITDAFNANRAQFNLPEDALHLAQIIVTPVRDQQIVNQTGDDATTPDAARAKVTMLMQRLQEGTPFADLARNYSEDAESTPRGGDLGLVPMSSIRQAPPPLRDAVLQLTPGKARVVNQGGAVTIIYVVSREPAGQRDLSTPGVKDQISQALKAQRQELMRTAYLAKLRNEAQITNYLARNIVDSQGRSGDPQRAAGK